MSSLLFLFFAQHTPVRVSSQCPPDNCRVIPRVETEEEEEEEGGGGRRRRREEEEEEEARARTHTHTQNKYMYIHIHTHTHLYIHTGTISESKGCDAQNCLLAPELQLDGAIFGTPAAVPLRYVVLTLSYLELISSIVFLVFTAWFRRRLRWPMS
jgi:hypothetical protein